MEVGAHLNASRGAEGRGQPAAPSYYIGYKRLSFRNLPLPERVGCRQPPRPGPKLGWNRERSADEMDAGLEQAHYCSLFVIREMSHARRQTPMQTPKPTRIHIRNNPSTARGQNLVSEGSRHQICAMAPRKSLLIRRTFPALTPQNLVLARSQHQISSGPDAAKRPAEGPKQSLGPTRNF